MTIQISLPANEDKRVTPAAWLEVDIALVNVQLSFSNLRFNKNLNQILSKMLRCRTTLHWIGFVNYRLAASVYRQQRILLVPVVGATNCR